MGSGLFVNDLFNGEALSGPPRESDRGIFRVNLFDGEPLGQTTPSITDAFTETASATVTTPHTATPLPSAKGGGGASMSTQFAQADGSGKGGGGAQTYSPYATPGADMSTYGSSSSNIPWTPILLIGGAVVVTIGAVVMFSKPKTATANRRARRNRRHRRHH
jgi:hypothetical protein